MEAQGGEDVYLLLIHGLGTRWGGWSASRSGRALTPGKGPPVPIGQEAGWAPEPVWTQEIRGKILCVCRRSNLDRPDVNNKSVLRISVPSYISLCF
jgi:hypothetical protein